MGGPTFVYGNAAHSDAGNSGKGTPRMACQDIGRHTIHCDCVGQTGSRDYQIATGKAPELTLNGDDCEIVIDSGRYGRLMVLSLQMAYLMAAVNDGILMETSFNLVDEETGNSERIRARLRFERIE